MLESEAIPVHFEDVDMVGETIKECSGQPLRAEYLGPLVEGQVGCHQDRPSLVALAEHLKEQLGPGLGQWHEAQFVDDQQLEIGQASLQVEQAPFVPGFHQFVHQGGSGGEAHGQSTLACSKTETEGDMSLAGAAVAESDDVLVALDVLAPGQLQHQSFVEGRHRQEVEGVQALGRWEDQDASSWYILGLGPPEPHAHVGRAPAIFSTALSFFQSLHIPSPRKSLVWGSGSLAKSE